MNSAIHRQLDGSYTAENVPGYYSVSRNNAWSRIHYCVPNESGIGLARKREFVGSVSDGIYGDGQFSPCPNRKYREQIEDRIRKHAADRD